MSVVVDASFAAAWLLPEEQSATIDAVLLEIEGRALVPSLFWYEIRNIMLMATRRGRIDAEYSFAALKRLRLLQLESEDMAGDAEIMELAATHALSAYDAAYLRLALDRGYPLATLDQKLAAAARLSAVALVGPLC